MKKKKSKDKFRARNKQKIHGEHQVWCMEALTKGFAPTLDIAKLVKKTVEDALIKNGVEPIKINSPLEDD